jgi:hypothetical protein
VRRSLTDMLGDVPVAALKQLQTLAQAAATNVMPLVATTRATARSAPLAAPTATAALFGSDLVVTSPWTAARFEREDRLAALLERTPVPPPAAAATFAPYTTPTNAAASSTAMTVVDRTYVRRLCAARLGESADEQQLEEVALALYALLASPRPDDALPSELLDLLGLDALEDMQTLLQHRAAVVAAVDGALARLEPVATTAPAASFGAQVTVATEAERRLSKARDLTPFPKNQRSSHTLHADDSLGLDP